ALPDVALRTVFSHDGARVIAGDWTGEIRVWTPADGKHIGNLTANPLSAAERLEAAQKELAAREAAYKPLPAAAAASQAAAQKAAGELAVAQQDLADKTAAAKIVNEAVVKAKQAADQANAALAVAQQ